MNDDSDMAKLQDKKGFICDMDGVIYHGDKLVDGAKDFVDWLKKQGKNWPGSKMADFG